MKHQAEEAQRAAATAQALQYSGEIYEQAVAALHRGDECLKANRSEQATEQFAQAKASFIESLQAAQREQEKEAARAAKEATLAARGEAQAGKAAEIFEEEFTEAVTLLQEAERELQEERYTAALTRFESSTTLFRRLSKQAITRVQWAKTLAAKLRAQRLQEQATSVTHWWQQRRARKGLNRGDRWFQQGDFERARKSYEEAATLYAELLKAAVAPRAARKGTVVPVSALRYLLPLLGLILLLSLILTYIHFPARP
jgi:tetratricopeptide (TPR) repeat protein